MEYFHSMSDTPSLSYTSIHSFLWHHVATQLPQASSLGGLCPSEHAYQMLVEQSIVVCLRSGIPMKSLFLVHLLFAFPTRLVYIVINTVKVIVCPPYDAVGSLGLCSTFCRESSVPRQRIMLAIAMVFCITEIVSHTPSGR